MTRISASRSPSTQPRGVRRFPGRLAAVSVALGAVLALPALANDELQKIEQEQGQWPMYSRDYANTRFSPLKEITPANVKNLKLAYALSLGSLRSNESTPIVIGDTLYVSSSWGPQSVFALDAAKGTIKWKYQPDLPGDTMQYGCCDVVSRGVSYSDGKIYVGMLNGYLVALDAKTGEEVWDAKVIDYKEGALITSPPLVVKDKVITGFGGGEYGVRGALVAFDSKSGKEAWRTHLTPGPGEPGNDTWKGDSWKNGGAAAWLVGAYDSKTDTVIYGTSNPAPWNNAARGPDSVDFGNFTNLYTSSTVGFDTNTGKIKWHLQSTPYDAWDYDGVNETILTDLKIDGKEQPVMMKADRNGYFYVANRTDGKIISAKTFVPVTWSKGIDLKTGRHQEDPDKRPRNGFTAKDICPNLLGGKNWQPMSFNPGTGLVYIPSNNLCMDMTPTEITYKKGAMFLGKEFPAKRGPGDHMGELIAWDPVAQKKVWGVKERTPFNGGTLSTGGGLVFAGNAGGDFRAFDAKEGKELWSIALGSGIGAGPMTFTAGGKQYVAIVVGRSGSIPAFIGDLGKVLVEQPEGGTLYVFSL